MSLHKLTKAQLIERLDAQADEVRRARRAIGDVQVEREKRQAVEAEIKRLKSPVLPAASRHDTLKESRFRQILERKNGRHKRENDAGGTAAPEDVLRNGGNP